MNNITFEYCSLQYLNLWLDSDMSICQALATGNKSDKLRALKKAGYYYRVARNLPTKFDEEKGLARFEPVLDIIDHLQSNQFEKEPVRKILEINNEISEKYGKRNVLSLTTKFLWLKIKQPIVIYDSQARATLNAENEALGDYYERWSSAFRAHTDEISRICSKLPDMYRYTAKQKIGTKEYIKEISDKTWFHERVFDLYLWNKGSNDGEDEVGTLGAHL